MAKFAPNDKVVQDIKPINGEVVGYQVDQNTGDLLVLVQWLDADGENHQRYFKESDLVAA